MVYVNKYDSPPSNYCKYAICIYSCGARDMKIRLLGSEGPSRWWRVRHGDHLPSQKYIKNTSTCGTTPTEHLLNAGRRPQTSQKFYFSFFFFSLSSEPCGWQGLGALAGCQAWASEVGEPRSGHWTSRDFLAQCNINWQELSQRSPSQR